MNDGFHHAWALHCVIGVGKDLGVKRVGKGLGMVHV